MSRLGIAANPRAQKLLRERDKRLSEQARDDFGLLLSTENGRRWFWHEFFDQLIQPIPTHSNVEMTGAAFLHNRAVERLVDAQQHPELFLEAFRESIARGAENQRIQHDVAAETKTEVDDG